jgi:LmbE family N-acetylglucosaminyl deacetylase
MNKRQIQRPDYGINVSMDWIYLSPHPDDVALSCGGLLWEQAQAGERPQVWTVCAGDPPAGPLSPFAVALQRRWKTGLAASQERRREDVQSCNRMQATYRHFPVPDCIYRREGWHGAHLYTSEESLFGPLDEREAGLVEWLRQEFERGLPNGARLVCPLSLGGHVDHRLTRAAAEGLGEALWYYADYPYALNHGEPPAHFPKSAWETSWFPISEAGMAAWEEAAAAHRSQISTFWPNLDSMRSALRAYAQQAKGGLGVRLWRSG